MARLVTILLLSVVLSRAVAMDFVVYDLEPDENGSGQRRTVGRERAAFGSGDEGSGAGDRAGSADRRRDCQAEGSGSDGSGGSGCDDGSGVDKTQVPTSTRATATPSPTPAALPCVKPAVDFNLVDEDKAMQRARCHAACLDNVRLYAPAPRGWTCLLLIAVRLFTFLCAPQVTSANSIRLEVSAGKKQGVCVVAMCE